MAVVATFVNRAARWSMLAVAAAALASSGGCDDKTAAGVATVKIAGKTFHLETAATNEKRFHGLSSREHIDPDGGMLFVFPATQPPEGFVMRDCPIAIDIIYVNSSGRVLTTYTMVPEAPRGPKEGVAGHTIEERDDADVAYDARLLQYNSRFPFQFAIELAGGTIKQLGVKESDQIEFDLDGLKKQAQ